MFSKLFLVQLMAILVGGIIMALPKWSPIRVGLRYLFHIFKKMFSREEKKEAETMEKEWPKEKIELLILLDADTLDEFFEEDYGKLILKLCFSFTHNEDEAWELYQRVSLEILTSISQLEDESKLISFLYKIVRNVWFDFLKSKKRDEKVKQGWIEMWGRAEITGPDETFWMKEMMKKIGLLLDRLTPREREAFILYYFEGLSLQETAGKMGISVEAVRVHLHNARKKLKGFLK